MACSIFLASPAPAQAALTSAQVEAVLNLLSAFGADAKIISNVRATLGGTATPAAGSLWFGAGQEPAVLTVEPGTERVPCTTISLINNSGGAVIIYTLTVERAGTASDSSLSEASLIGAAGAVLATAPTLGKHQTTLTPGALTLAKGQSLTLTVAGTVAKSARANRTVGLTVVAVNASSPILGSLPLTGVLHKIH